MIASTSKWHTMFIQKCYYSVPQSTCALAGQHKEVLLCECGRNTICYNCGYGEMAIPCNCSKPIILGITSNGSG